MKIVFSERFLDALEYAPPVVRNALYKQLVLLKRNLRHPSLRARKYDEAHGLWQARVNRAWCFYFTIEGDEYRLQAITPHPK